MLLFEEAQPGVQQFLESALTLSFGGFSHNLANHEGSTDITQFGRGGAGRHLGEAPAVSATFVAKINKWELQALHFWCVP